MPIKAQIRENCVVMSTPDLSAYRTIGPRQKAIGRYPVTWPIVHPPPNDHRPDQLSKSLIDPAQHLFLPKKHHLSAKLALSNAR